MGVIKQATSIKYGGQETMVSLNAEILKDVIVQVDIADLKVSVLYPPLPELI